MKRLVSLAALLVLASAHTASLAQDRIGFFGGLNFATVQESPGRKDFNVSQRADLHAGTLYESACTRAVALRFESSYIKKGVRLQERLSTPASPRRAQSETVLNFTYGETALLVKLALASEIVSPYLFAGPTASYLFGVKSSRAFDDGDEIKTEEQDLTSRYRNFDFGASFGLGFRFRDFFLEGRYGLGLRDAARDERSEASHRGWQIVAGVSAPI